MKASRSSSGKNRPPRKHRPPRMCPKSRWRKKVRSRWSSPRRSIRWRSPPSMRSLSSATHRDRHEVIHDLVSEAMALLRDVELQYAFTGKGKREVLRGRPVAFALWSDAKQEWTVAHIEIPRPPVKWKPGGKPISFTVRTPGIKARHVTGTGAERLMFAFSRDGEQLKVYGRKFPVFDATLLNKKKWRASRCNREADHLPAIHRRHLRSAFCQRREGLPAFHRAQGDRRLASRKSARSGISRRASRRRRARRSHLDPRSHRTDG